jgi:hypothetical protein
MEELKARAAPGALPAPEEKQPDILPKEEARPDFKPLPGIIPLSSKEETEIRFDPTGKKIPRSDRWEPVNFEWELPELPSSDLPPSGKVAVAEGPFTRRLQSLFEDRPEAVDRLCAAAEARTARFGEARILDELSKELSRKQWDEKKLPAQQQQRLAALDAAAETPGPWRAVARFLLDRI